MTVLSPTATFAQDANAMATLRMLRNTIAILEMERDSARERAAELQRERDRAQRRRQLALRLADRRQQLRSTMNTANLTFEAMGLSNFVIYPPLPSQNPPSFLHPDPTEGLRFVIRETIEDAARSLYFFGTLRFGPGYGFTPEERARICFQLFDMDYTSHDYYGDLLAVPRGPQDEEIAGPRPWCEYTWVVCLCAAARAIFGLPHSLTMSLANVRTFVRNVNHFFSTMPHLQLEQEHELDFLD